MQEHEAYDPARVRSEAAHRALALANDQRLTLLLDLDGTLIPFAPTPEDATLDRPAVLLLEALHQAGVDIVIISGRPRALIDPLCERAAFVRWVAEHGSWRRTAQGEWIGPEQATELVALASLLGGFAAQPGAMVEQKSLSMCLHWRLVPEAQKAALIASATRACDDWIAAHDDFERLDGVEMLEVRRRSAHKGVAVDWVRSERPDARFVAIGDDVTDEDMFAALGSEELAIGVGPRPATAMGWLAGPTAVRNFLWWIVETRTAGHARVEPPLDVRTRVR